MSTKDLQANSNALRVCPFCGGEAELVSNDIGVFVGCFHENCPIGPQTSTYLDGYATEAEAVAAWNTRAEKKPTDAVREFAERYERRIAELEEQIAEIEAERTCRNLAEPDEMSDDPFTCSECGARGPYGDGIYHIGGSEKNEDGSVVFWDSWPVYKYCPNCGRKVEG